MDNEEKLPKTKEEIKKYYIENYGYAGWISQISNGTCHFKTCSWEIFEKGINETKIQIIEEFKIWLEQFEKK